MEKADQQTNVKHYVQEILEVKKSFSLQQRQCSKLRVRPAPSAHISVDGGTFFCAVPPVCARFFNLLLWLNTRGVHEQAAGCTFYETVRPDGAQNKTLISNTERLSTFPVNHISYIYLYSKIPTCKTLMSYCWFCKSLESCMNVALRVLPKAGHTRCRPGCEFRVPGCDRYISKNKYLGQCFDISGSISATLICHISNESL